METAVSVVTRPIAKPPWACSVPGPAMEVLVGLVSLERCTSAKFRQVCATWRQAHDGMLQHLQVKRCDATPVPAFE
jgi:hypothetical protein